MSKALQKIDDHKYVVLQELIDRLSHKHRKFLANILGTTIAREIPDNKIRSTIQLCERTLALMEQ